MVALRGLEPVTLTLPGAGGTLNRGIVLPSLREGIDTRAPGRVRWWPGYSPVWPSWSWYAGTTIYLVVAVRGDTPD